jgi:hypothetical protein
VLGALLFHPLPGRRGLLCCMTHAYTASRRLPRPRRRSTLQREARQRAGPGGQPGKGAPGAAASPSRQTCVCIVELS